MSFYISLYVHFCLPKNEPKRAAAHLVSLWLTSLCCSQRTGDIGMSLTLRRVAYPLFAPLLGCVKWPVKHFIAVNKIKSLFKGGVNF